MSDKASSLYQKLYNNPHLMTSELFNSVEQFLVKAEANPIGEAEASLTDCPWKATIDDLQYNADTGVGILPITGMLTYEDSGYWWMDTTSYKSLLDNAKTMFEAGATTVVLDLDSGGGIAYSMTQTASELRRMADEYGVKLISYNDGIAASACYGLGCAAHEFISNPDAETGSIGVVVSLTNYSGYESKLGIKRTYITAGDGKVPYTKDGDFSKEFLDDIQTKVDALYERFTSHVAQYRNISQDSVKALGAKVYSSSDAVANGLVDKIMTREEFFTYLADITQEGKPKPMALGKYFNPKATQLSKEAAMPNQNVDLQAALEAAKADFTAQLDSEKKASAASLASMKAELEAAKAELSAVNKEKEDAKQATRLAELTKIFGTTEAPKLAASFASLDDDSFNLTVGILAARAVKEEENLQAEVGAEGVPVVEGEESLSLADLKKQEAERKKAKYTKNSK